MRQSQLISLAAMAAISGYASTSHAHFKLLSPGSWLMEDSAGGPQKGSPCGVGGADDVNPPPLSNKVTEYHAGEEIEVKWVDTIAHPGHFRIALAEKREDLKDPTIKQDSFCSYDESMVPKEASGNVLADGVSFRSRTGFSAQAGTMFSQKVKLPDTPCEKCTLQVMQVMENDLQSLSNCYYFHCADIKILPAAGGATAGSGAAGSSAAAGASGSTSTAGAGGSSAAGTGAAGSSAGAGGAATAAGASGSVAAAGAAGSARAGSPATSTAAGSSASAAGSTSAAAGTLASSGAAGASGTPATGTTTNAATGTGTTSGDSSGCSVNGAGAASNASSAIFVAGVILMNARRRRRQPARCASSKPRR